MIKIHMMSNSSVSVMDYLIQKRAAKSTHACISQTLRFTCTLIVLLIVTV